MQDIAPTQEKQTIGLTHSTTLQVKNALLFALTTDMQTLQTQTYVIISRYAAKEYRRCIFTTTAVTTTITLSPTQANATGTEFAIFSVLSDMKALSILSWLTACLSRKCKSPCLNSQVLADALLKER